MTLTKHFHEIFNQDDYVEMDTSLNFKLLKLGIDPIREHELMNMPVDELDDLIKVEKVGNLQVISLDSLKGWNRVDGNKRNWLDCLEGLHKMINFTLYKGREEFETFLNDKGFNSWHGYPSVIEYKGGYYVDGNGKHRLTIAKCIGIKTAPAVVKKIFE